MKYAANTGYTTHILTHTLSPARSLTEPCVSFSSSCWVFFPDGQLYTFGSCEASALGVNSSAAVCSSGVVATPMLVPLSALSATPTFVAVARGRTAVVVGTCASSGGLVVHRRQLLTLPVFARVISDGALVTLGSCDAGALGRNCSGEWFVTSKLPSLTNVTSVAMNSRLTAVVAGTYMLRQVPPLPR